MSNGTWEERIDRAIDEVTAGRPGGRQGGDGRAAGSPGAVPDPVASLSGQRPLDLERDDPPRPVPGPAESLVERLGQLRPVDWPDQGVPDRIAGRLASALGEADPGPAAAGGERAPGSPGSPRKAPGPVPTGQGGDHDRAARSPGSRRKVAVTVAVAAAVIAAALVALVGYGGLGGTASRGTTAPSVVASPGWRLVDSVSSPFAAVGSGPQAGDLECVTATTCYASNDAAGPDGTRAPDERTTDGGATWQPMAALPDGMGLDWPLSCPTAQTCVGAVSSPPPVLTAPGPVGGPPRRGAEGASLPLVVTTDGGSHWQVVTVPSPAGMTSPAIDQVACATAEQCVVHVDGTAPAPAAPAPTPGEPTPTPTARTGAFLTTDDGGATWTAASSAPAAVSDPLWALRCTAGGTCLGIAVQPTTPGAMVALRSDDGGKTWTAEPPAPTGGMGTMEISCGDASHCVVVYPSTTGTGVVVATTADGGATWQASAAPSTWPQVGIAVSCATGEDCWISAADSSQSGYDDPAIEATHDGGATWSSLPLPSVGGSALALVFPLSCPTSAGCIGVGATPQEFNARPAVSSTGDGSPLACSSQAGCASSSTTTSGVPVPGRVIVSNLPQQ